MNSSMKKYIVVMLICFLGIMYPVQADVESCKAAASLLSAAESAACSAGAAVLRNNCNALPAYPPGLRLTCHSGVVVIYLTCMTGVGLRYYDRLRECENE
jgi:hypothetical protein